jgi:alpha-galactosidase
MTKAEFTHLRSEGLSLLIDYSTGTPQILHFGPDLGELTSARDFVAAGMEPVAHAELDDPEFVGIWRENSRGNIGRPALLGHRSGKDFSQKFEIGEVLQTSDSVTINAQDPLAGLAISSSYRFAAGGVLLAATKVTNLGSEDFTVDELLTYLPLPDQIAESIDFTGRWLKERQLQRRPIQSGIFSRELREGRSSHDYTIVQLACTPGAGFETGEVYGMGVLFSGNLRHLIEKQPSGRTHIAAGELLLPGEVILASGESYQTPEVAIFHSAAGMDGISDRSYRWLRARADHPSKVRPRPLTLNVWEAVYFDHNLEKLSELAEVAQRIGVERFVLDDGWFGARRNDLQGLGDWVVSKDVWPEGLGPLIDKVKSCGMEFGLWFEGEMVQVDSDLYRAHPEWILNSHGRVPPSGRRQHVLDITHPGAFEHVLGQVDRVLSDFDISYIKWDHNKFLVEPGHLNRAAVREQTLAIYRLFDELKRRHPGLEIESCASGGGRVDLGMAFHADRFWTSDCNDAMERQKIQRYTQMVIPPELLGSHIGPTKSHTTMRVQQLSFRAISALFGHAGLEWDITQCSEQELETLKTWADYYKQNRELIHTGRMVRVDGPSDTALTTGVVSQDGARAIFSYAVLDTQSESRPAAIRLAGLDASRQYRVKAVFPAGEPKYLQRAQVQWLTGVTLSGSYLMTQGLRAPILFPENALLIEIEAI